VLLLRQKCLVKRVYFICAQRSSPAAAPSFPYHTHVQNTPRNAFSSYGCPAPVAGSAESCCANVDAWGTAKGDVVWVTHCASQEVVDHEENRVWRLTPEGRLINPVSGLCADAKAGSCPCVHPPAHPSPSEINYRGNKLTTHVFAQMRTSYQALRRLRVIPSFWSIATEQTRLRGCSTKSTRH
jgi:hypothetical protein